MKIEFKLSLFLIAAFMLFTIVGTLSHEFGHIIVAKIFGYETELNYRSMTYNHKGYNEDENVETLFKIYEDNLKAINNNQEFVDKQRFDELKEILNKKYPANQKHEFWITLGGPLQTILTCVFGFMILGYRKPQNKNVFKILDWLGVFLGFFILRKIFNFGLLGYDYIINSRQGFTDEIYLSQTIFDDNWTVPWISLIVGMLISLYIIFKVIPYRHRLTFIISGLIGGVLGYLFWFNWLGKIVLP